MSTIPVTGQLLKAGIGLVGEFETGSKDWGDAMNANLDLINASMGRKLVFAEVPDPITTGLDSYLSTDPSKIGIMIRSPNMVINDGVFKDKPNHLAVYLGNSTYFVFAPIPYQVICTDINNFKSEMWIPGNPNLPTENENHFGHWNKLETPTPSVDWSALDADSLPVLNRPPLLGEVWKAGPVRAPAIHTAAPDCAMFANGQYHLAYSGKAIADARDVNDKLTSRAGLTGSVGPNAFASLNGVCVLVDSAGVRTLNSEKLWITTLSETGLKAITADYVVGVFCVVGDNGKIFNSVDGVNWVAVSHPLGQTNLADVCSDRGGSIVAVGANSAILHVSHLSNTATVGSVSSTGKNIKRIFFIANQFIAITGNGELFRQNGSAWQLILVTTSDAPVTASFKTIIATQMSTGSFASPRKPTFIMLADTGNFFYVSTNLIGWNQVTPGSIFNITRILDVIALNDRIYFHALNSSGNSIVFHTPDIYSSDFGYNNYVLAYTHTSKLCDKFVYEQGTLTLWGNAGCVYSIGITGASDVTNFNNPFPVVTLAPALSNAVGYLTSQVAPKKAIVGSGGFGVYQGMEDKVRISRIGDGAADTDVATVAQLKKLEEKLVNLINNLP